MSYSLGDRAFPFETKVAVAWLQRQQRHLGGLFNMGGAAVANYVSILERLR
jgi:hypothetical protein